jgi:DNA-binding MarR family transcriptional regulator
MSKRPESDPKGHAWALLLAAHATLVERIAATLAAAGLPPLEWYDVLWELEKVEDGRLRMHDLARRVVLSRSNLTRLADRLERERLIARAASPEDGRGAYCVLTPAGRALRRRMWPVYREAIDARFARHVTDREAGAMSAVLERVLRAERAELEAAGNPVGKTGAATRRR